MRMESCFRGRAALGLRVRVSSVRADAALEECVGRQVRKAGFVKMITADAWGQVPQWILSQRRL